MRKKGLVIGAVVLLAGSAAMSEDVVNDPAVNQDSLSGVQTPSDSIQKFTAGDLAKYDGKDGRKAYVAIADSVYDVTDVKPWKGGKHHGLKAGLDLTEKIKNSPHGKAVLKKVKVVGIFVKE